MKKVLKRILTVACVATMGLCLFSACNGGENGCGGGTPTGVVSVYDAAGTLVFDTANKSVTVEYGDTYRLPSNIQVDGKKVDATSVKLFNEAGTEVKLVYGSYTFNEVGNYTVKYEAGDKKAEFTVVCVDTVAPVIKVVGYDEYGTVGDKLLLPNCTYEDKAGIKEGSVTFTLTAPDGTAGKVEDGYFLLEQVGDYTVTVSVEDNNGLKSETSVKVKAIKAYVDENLGEKSLFNFNTEDYKNLVVNLTEGVETTYEIVDTGYPTIEGEGEDNKVLKVTSTASWKNVNTQFISYDGKMASSGYSVVVRIAFSKDTDYVKLFRNKDSISDAGLAGQMWGLKANTWYDWEIDPISFGYHTEFKDFVIAYRDKGDDIAMYIDEIYFTDQKFVDETKAENVIADFDEEGYEYNVFQNIYCDPTTTRGFRVTGTKFDILPADSQEIPAANPETGVFPNLGASGGVLKFEISDQFGGLTYMFPETIKLDQINALTFKMYAPIPDWATIIFGFFDEVGYDGGNTRWVTAGESFTGSKWVEITLPAYYLQRFTTSGELSGVFLQILPNKNGDWTTASWGQTLYLDEIAITPKAAQSEQFGDTIATFESAACLNNAFTSIKEGDATLTQKEGALVAKPTATDDLSFSFEYTFDQIVAITEQTSLSVKLATGAASTHKVRVYAINKEHAPSLLGEYALTAEYVGNYQTLGFSGKQILELIPTGEVAALKFTVLAKQASADNALLLDGITLYEAESDVAPPTILSKEDVEVEVLAGGAIDLSQANVEVVDDKDPNPSWKVVKLLAPDGTDITANVTDRSFVPTVGGEYTVEFKAVDLAGNESATSQSFKLTVSYISDSKAYYANRLQFGDATSLSLVTTDKGEPELVDDQTATDGKAMKATFENGNGGAKRITIDLGGVYKVAEIESITFAYRMVDGVSGAGSVGINQNPYWVGSTKFEVDWIDCSKNAYIVKTVQMINIKAKMGLTNEDTLDSFVVALLDWKPNVVHTILIDYIQLNEGDGTAEAPIPEGSLDYSKVNFSNRVELAIATSQTGVAPTLVADSTAEDGWALKGTFYNHTGTRQEGKHLLLAIGEYKMSEIEQIKIRFRFETTVDLWPSLTVNSVATDKTQDVYSIKCIEWGQYRELTISADHIKEKAGLTDEDILENIIFAMIDYKPDDTFTILIDSLSVVLKDITGDLEEGTVDYKKIEFATQSEFALANAAYGSDTKIVEDSSAKDGYALSAQFIYNKPLTVNLGKAYTVGDIESLVITYRCTTQNSGDWIRMTVNGAVMSSFVCPTTALSSQSFTSTTITAAKLIENGLTEDTELEAFGFAMLDWKPDSYIYTVEIDSIVIREKITQEDLSALLNFNVETALNLVTAPYGETAIVDDSAAAGGKALQASFVCDDSGRKNVTISLGSIYTLGEVESITVSWRFAETMNDWPSIKINTATTDKTSDVAFLNGSSETYTASKITAETIKTKNGLTDEDILKNIIFTMIDYKPNNVYTILIDSIVVTVKE